MECSISFNVAIFINHIRQAFDGGIQEFHDNEKQAANDDCQPFPRNQAEIHAEAQDDDVAVQEEAQVPFILKGMEETCKGEAEAAFHAAHTTSVIEN